MVYTIEQDHQRFRQIVRGKIRKDLRRFISRGDFLGRANGKTVAVPIHDVDLPNFRYGDNSTGVGMGDGEGSGEGDAAGRTEGGDEPGKHVTEVNVTLDELADILGEELRLPRIEPKGEHKIATTKDRYTGLRPVGPASLRHFKRTYREALKRQIALGLYEPDAPVIAPIKRDMRYRSWREERKPQSNALIVFMMDVSGSMGREQKELVRLQAFWIEAWLQRNYEGVESRYIVHDVNAAEVDRETFFSLREDGGTRISSAYARAADVLEANYDPSAWNTYLFHFSDGDNSSEADNRLCVDIMRQRLLPVANMFAYSQVSSPYGSGAFINVLRDAFGGEEPDERVVTARVENRDGILDAIRQFFTPGL